MHPKPEEREAASQWARQLLSSEFYILDTETTGLNRDEPDYPCEITVLDGNGNAVIDTLVKPPKSIPPEASRIHGISNLDVSTAPSFEAVWPQLAALRDKKFIIYNASYDLGILRSACLHYGLLANAREIVLRDAECAMLRYSCWFGDWNRERSGYRWQRLPGAGHRAKDDCVATLALLRLMAQSS